jgi:hypothetical protein
LAARYLLIRSKGKLYRLLKIQISNKKGEVFISPPKTGGMVELFEGSENLQSPVGEDVNQNINFTEYMKGGVGNFRGNFHIGYRATGVSVLKVGILTHAFKLPGLKEMQGTVELEQYYPAKLDLYPETPNIRRDDILLPDTLQFPPANLIPDRFKDKNIEEIFGENPFFISLIAIPKHLTGFSQSFRPDEMPFQQACVFARCPHFTLCIMVNQESFNIEQEWPDHARHINGRSAITRIVDKTQHMQIDFRIVRYFLSSD